MRGKWLSIAARVLVGSVFLSLSSCGREQQLVSIQIQPGTETFGASNIPVNLDAGLQTQLRALGSYIHPPVTKDITNQVTWGSNTPQMVTVNSTGLITATGLSCGTTLISATVQTNQSSGNISSSGAIVTGTMQANVVCDTGTGGSNPALTVSFGVGVGSGNVLSTPAGINCTTTCTADFATATQISLLATPNPGSTLSSWAGCDSVTGQTCVINSLTADRTVTVTFN